LSALPQILAKRPAGSHLILRMYWLGCAATHLAPSTCDAMRQPIIVVPSFKGTGGSVCHAAPSTIEQMLNTN